MKSLPVGRAARAAVLLLSAVAPLAASAHDAWLEPVAGGWAVKYGDGRPEPYPSAKVKTVAALDAQGAPLAVRRTDADDGGETRIAVQGGAPALLLLSFDNGYFSKGASGRTLNLPADQNPGAKGGSHAVKFHKTVVAWAPAVAAPVGHRLELVPLSAEPPTAGRPMKFRLLFEGRPLAGAKVSTGENADGPKTDADGVASFTPAAGPNVVWSAVRRTVANDPRYDVDSVQINFRFDAR